MLSCRFAESKRLTAMDFSCALDGIRESVKSQVQSAGK